MPSVAWTGQFLDQRLDYHPNGYNNLLTNG